MIQAFSLAINCSILNEDIQLMKSNPLLYQTTNYLTKTALERCVEELKMTEFSQQYKVLKPKINAKVYSAFNCVLFNVSDINKIENESKYKIVDNTGTELMLKGRDSVLIQSDDLSNKRYQVYVKNTRIFKTNKYFSLQHIDQCMFAECNRKINFAKGLEKQKGKIIVWNSNNENKKYHSQILEARYVLICDENINAKQLSADEMYAKHFIYQFQSIQDICFIIPFKLKMGSVKLYAQVSYSTDFVFIKKYDVIVPITKDNRKSRIDYLLKILQIYKVTIQNRKEFYQKIGVILKDSDSAFIKNNNMFYKPTLYDPTKMICTRLVEELNVNGLSQQYNLLNARFSVHSLPVFGCVVLNPLKYHEAHSEYKIVVDSDDEKIAVETAFTADKGISFKPTNSTASYTVFVKNKYVFGTKQYFPLQQIHESFVNYADFPSKLKIVENKVIVLDSHNFDEMDIAEILSARYVLVCDNDVVKEQSKYKFDTVDDIYF
eukprot:207343_1